MLRTRSAGSGTGPAAFALRALALFLGIFFLFQGLGKLPWLLDSGILDQRLRDWAGGAPPAVRWYIETLAMPGVPLFARMVPLAEVGTGLALLIGFWVRLAAALALAMVINFHFALGSFFALREFLVDGAGLPVMGGLLALVIGAARLPWSLRP